MLPRAFCMPLVRNRAAQNHAVSVFFSFPVVKTFTRFVPLVSYVISLTGSHTTQVSSPVTITAYPPRSQFHRAIIFKKAPIRSSMSFGTIWVAPLTLRREILAKVQKRIQNFSFPSSVREQKCSEIPPKYPNIVGFVTAERDAKAVASTLFHIILYLLGGDDTETISRSQVE